MNQFSTSYFNHPLLLFMSFLPFQRGPNVYSLTSFQPITTHTQKKCSTIVYWAKTKWLDQFWWIKQSHLHLRYFSQKNKNIEPPSLSTSPPSSRHTSRHTLRTWQRWQPPPLRRARPPRPGRRRVRPRHSFRRSRGSPGSLRGVQKPMQSGSLLCAS